MSKVDLEVLILKHVIINSEFLRKTMMFNLESFYRKGSKRGKITPKKLFDAGQNLMDVLVDLLDEISKFIKK